MPVLTDLASAEVKWHVKKLYGVTIGIPKLLASDGLNDVYAVDVNIGPTDPTGAIRQYVDEKNNSTFLTGIPTQKPEDWQLDDSLPGHVDTTLHNCIISKNNLDVVYADSGSPVVCERDESGRWMITGFSMERPGTHILYPVDLGDMTLGTVIDLSIDVRLLDLGEIGTMRPFGVLPFGASAIFRGGELQSIV